MTTLKELLRRGTLRPVFGCYIKRMSTDGAYEADWYDVSQYVVAYPDIEYSIGDEVLFGDFSVSGGTIKFVGFPRKFGHHTDPASLWWGYGPRHNTLIKITLGLRDDDPTAAADDYSVVSGLTWYGLITGSPKYDDGHIAAQTRSLLAALQQTPATGISTAAGTTAEIMARLIDKRSQGVPVFDRYFQAAADIDPDTAAAVTISTPVIDPDATVWDKVCDLSRYEGFFPSVSQAGGFVWRSRQSAYGDPVWKFFGPGEGDVEYGQNVVSIDEISEDIDRYYGRVVISYGDLTASVTAKRSWVPGDGSPQAIYGETVYSADMSELDVAEAGQVADRVLADNATVKTRIKLTALIAPTVMPGDIIEITFRDGLSALQGGFMLAESILGTDEIYARSGTWRLNKWRGVVVSARHVFQDMTTALEVISA